MMRAFQDCRLRSVRVVACFAGRVLRFTQTGWRILEGVWTTFGGANFLMNAMAIMVAFCCALLVWWAVFEDVVPLREAEVVLVVPGDRIIDRDQNDDFTITRRVCMSRGAWGTVNRAFVGEGNAGLEYKLVSSAPIFLQSGCHERSRTIDIPFSLPPGRYTYRSSIQFCNKLRCEDAGVQDVPVAIRGRWPVEPTGGPGAIRDPM